MGPASGGAKGGHRGNIAPLNFAIEERRGRKMDGREKRDIDEKFRANLSFSCVYDICQV